MRGQHFKPSVRLIRMRIHDPRGNLHKLSHMPDQQDSFHLEPHRYIYYFSDIITAFYRRVPLIPQRIVKEITSVIPRNHITDVMAGIP